jgi:hypothetical protein
MAAAVQKWSILQDLYISVATPGEVSDEDWKVFLQAVREHPAITKCLFANLGKVEATSLQRKQGAELFKSRNIRAAVITDDTFVRGLVTAVNWLGANVNAFSWSDTKNALKYLGTVGSAAERAHDVLTKLRAEAEAAARGSPKPR